MAEQRIIGSQSQRIGTKPGSAAPTEEATAAPSRRNRKPLVLIGAGVAAVAGGAGWFLTRPDIAAPVAEPEVELGVVQTVEPVSINLADGRYLRLGLGLQLTALVEEDVDPSRALDTAIALFSQRPVTEVSTPEGREALKAELGLQLAEAYEGEVVDVYFTNFVYQ
jgi:flagellar FliL protein